MAIFQSLAAFGVRQLVDGVLSTVGLSAGGEAVVGLLAARFTDHSGKLATSLGTANERAWKALEIAGCPAFAAPFLDRGSGKTTAKA